MDEGYVQDFEEGEAHDNEENGHQYASRKYISSLKRAPFYLAAGLLVVAGVVLLISSALTSAWLKMAVCSPVNCANRRSFTACHKPSLLSK